MYRKQTELVDIAERCGRHSKEVQRQQILLSKSLNFCLVAVRNTILNPGSQTPGVDNKTLTNQSTNGDKIQMVETIQKQIISSSYESHPVKWVKGVKGVKGVKIPKANGKTLTLGLGIPTIRDRCLQNLMKLVLEPLVESQSDPNSYGCRPHRSEKNALGYLRYLLYSH